MFISHENKLAARAQATVLLTKFENYAFEFAATSLNG